ncbi:MAG: FHA domain-containing protein [Myxococcales bacterium]|nr:FHA domain-containing protein [Myxococcales bacterium]
MNQANDASKKSPRTFQCRDQLWETFEGMARELECSIDYLINEAMKQYARQRSYGGAGAAPPPSRTPFPGQPMAEPAPPPPAQRQPLPPTAPAVPMARPQPPPPAHAPPPVHAPPPAPPPAHTAPPARLPPPPAAPAQRLPPPPPPGGRPGAAPPPPPPGRPGGPPPLPRSSMPPPPPPPAMPAPLPPMTAPTQPNVLTALYQGERTPVNKEKFIIGRGRQTSDLTIKDPNVSRQHAMIEFQNGVYYMVDLGSTNGVEFHGQRVTRKAIAEGDLFRICDHEVLFTYR